MKTKPYQPKHKIRIVTAGSLFDGHDASINIMRRIMQASGAEVIHLGHNRSAQDVVNCAIQEDVQAIAMTSYQGGHNEYFKYIYDLLQEADCGHIKLFGGGGGTILPSEIRTLHAYGICRIYSPDDGRKLGLQGMINDLLAKSDFAITEMPMSEGIPDASAHKHIAQIISAFEHKSHRVASLSEQIAAAKQNVAVLGITGTGGAGKSSMVDELVRRFLADFEDKTLAIISVDPSKRKTGGALLGDRIRMNAISDKRVYMRSLATRQSNVALSAHIPQILDVLKAAHFDLIILESSGIGQSDSQIADFADLALYVMTPEYGAASQLEKIDMLDFADLIAINKFDKQSAEDALRDVRKQYQRTHNLWESDPESLPVFGTIASQFNDVGTHRLYAKIIEKLREKALFSTESRLKISTGQSEKIHIIPPNRVRYLSEISETIRHYNGEVSLQSTQAGKLQHLSETKKLLEEAGEDVPPALQSLYALVKSRLSKDYLHLLQNWTSEKMRYEAKKYVYRVRNKQIEIDTHSETLSGTKLPKVCLPGYEGWSDLLRWMLQENVPGKFPFTAGVFPFKRKGEAPTRMFAGEGGPERTNKRFHYLSKGQTATRLSTAFDSVTLYGENPDHRPDVYGKIGNAGVNVCCLDDAKKLYSGFDLSASSTSVSMTINGPAAAVAAFFMHAAIDQQCEKHIRNEGREEEIRAKIKQIYTEKQAEQPQYSGEIPEGHNQLGLMLLGICGDQLLEKDVYEKIKADTLSAVRGTVQADILKEDQAQNTCIFSTEFSLRLMGDMQAFFTQHKVKNFYSVSISGYHIAEAGANPITQLAFTLSNGFTFVEYYLSRGLDINDFAPNLSFFFSNGIDAEYAVIGRVARRIWAKAMKLKYGANARAQKLKYHIQTSGRSLHAQEIAFNDIRTTLQALYAIYDNCNSLHTNAYDEAITTPTEESVRRALAIQLIINQELGMAQNENPLQGAFVIEALTDLVEEAVLLEFDRLTMRGGVLGAMETMYQRTRIQEESMYYETKKHSGSLPIIGVNTFLSGEGSPTIIPQEVIRSTDTEKEAQIRSRNAVHTLFEKESAQSLQNLQQTATRNENTFAALMEAAKYCTLGQITQALYEVGGQYRRNM